MYYYVCENALPAAANDESRDNDPTSEAKGAIPQMAHWIGRSLRSRPIFTIFTKKGSLEYQTWSGTAVTKSLTKSGPDVCPDAT